MNVRSRRSFLHVASATGLVAVAGPIVATRAAQAADGKAAFEAKTTADAMKALGIAPAESKEVHLKAPDIAENGAEVPLEITSHVPGTQSIAVFIDRNPFPFVASFDVSKGALPFVALRVKMSETSNVRAVAVAGGKAFAATKEVKVTIGGCGA
jgi:sulfur-oxidizing protein SoxY